MPLLENGEAITDAYVTAPDDSAPDGAAIFSLARLAAEPDLLARNQPIGVMVDGNTDLEALAPLLSRLALVVVRFPIFRDGRGFTLARALRERFGYAGTLRATGHLLPDQYMFLLRCGYDQVETKPEADLGPWKAALTRFHTAYQPAVRDEPVLLQLRRRLQG
jgi:uncharacterized protein (DUF934 family)